MEKLETYLQNKSEIRMFNDFVTNFSSREERHYCAYLFSWLISSDQALRAYLDNHSGDLGNKISNEDVKRAKAYYEYTALRELLDSVKRRCSNGYEIKEKLKEIIESEIFTATTGDIQKKKPDLVFYFPVSKSILLVEAKFEMDFDKSQINQSIKYGDILKILFPDQVTNVYVSALGLNYYTEKQKGTCPTISWEKIHSILPEGKVKNEIKTGLDYQKKLIHKNALKNWE